METIPIHDMPNISPFSSLYSAGLTIKINNGIIKTICIRYRKFQFGELKKTEFTY